ncbi:MAG: NADH-quinone oxidoreductase subunit G, partial [Candidatus Kapaibacterium sp.]
MVVTTSDAKSEKASNAVMEFLLINHPLDCPICDEAGQCKLQEYAYKFSKGESRFVEGKNHKDKRVAWGPNVMFDGERCISCSRCIRYASEVAQQPVLTFVQRGDHVTIETFEGTQFDSPYSMNVIELCPVGALTSIDFRFKARVWDMSFNDSICPGCARGCNMSVGVRDNTILRLEPRANPHVNTYWMCDAGRTTQYSWVNETRVTGAHVRTDGQLRSGDWKGIISEAAANLKGYAGDSILVVVGGKSTNEDAFAASRLAREVLSTKNIVYVRNEDAAFGDEFLRRSDRNANSRGFESMGISSVTAADLAARIASSQAVLV